MLSDIVAGVAQLIAAAGLGVWRPDGTPYGQGETAVVDSTVPEQPDRLIVLTAYQVDDELGTDSIVGLQVRTRTPGPDPRPCRDLDDALFALLHARTHMQLPTGPHIVSCRRTSGTDLGLDENRRRERASSYVLRTHWPAPYRMA